MGMTIDNSIETLTSILKEATESCDSVCYVTSVDAEALKMAIDTMRKYQKIKDIYYHQSGEALENSLRAVIEDGKID